MKIRHLTIENFRAIERLDIDCSGNVNAFIGDNGAGKSTVLEVLVLLFSWLNARLTSPNGRGRNIRKDDIRFGAEYCYLAVEVEYKVSRVRWSLLKGTAPDSWRRTNLKELEPIARRIREMDEDEQNGFVSYGVNRNITTIALEKKVYGKKEGKLETVRNSVSSIGWRQFFNWYYERENEENRMKARFNPQYHDESLDSIRECLAEVFPGYQDLHIEDRPARFVIEKMGQTINFDRLSDGEKCYITLVLDIARRLSMKNDGRGAVLAGEQIILIDELDLHLHPSWQLQVVSNLERKFPNCQFFVTSHSSLVLSSLGERDRLVLLRDGHQVELSDMPYGDNGDYILKRFFGLKAVRNPQVQAVIDSIASELGKKSPDINLIERKLAMLKQQGVQFEESVKMRLLLAQKRNKAHEED